MTRALRTPTAEEEASSPQQRQASQPPAGVRVMLGEEEGKGAVCIVFQVR
jgi:hypothetical protein